MLHGIINFNLMHQIKTNPSLLPMIVIGGIGSILAVLSSIRHLVKDPDVVIDRKHNPKPWDSKTANGNDYYCL